MSIRSDWESVTNRPDYQGASDADREQKRNEFFQNRIARNLMPGQEAQARQIFDGFTAPQGDPTSGTLNDLRLAFQSGAAGGFGDLTQGVMLGNESRLSNWFRKKSDEYSAGMSPSMIEDIGNTGFDYNSEDGITIKDGSTARGAVGLLFQGGGSLLPSVVPGMAVSRALSVAGRAAAGTTAAVSAASRAKSSAQAHQAFTRASMIESRASNVGFGLVGGASMMGSTVNQSYDDLMSMSQEERNQSEPYQRRFYELREQGLTDGEASEQAWEEVAREASMSGRGRNFLVGFGSSALTGPIEAKLLTGAGSASRASNIARGIATEMGQEAVESGWQEIASNLNVAEAGIERDWHQDVAGNTLTGMAVGGAIGGIMGGASKPNRPRTREELSQEHESYSQKQGEIEQKLMALDQTKDADKSKVDTERQKLEMELGGIYRHLYDISEERKNAPTTEQLGQSQKNEKVDPAAKDTGPAETPDRRNYLPYNIDIMLAEAERDSRKIMSDYNRAMGNKGRGDLDTAQQFEQELTKSNETVRLLKLMTNNRHNQQYFPSEDTFGDWINKQFIGGDDNLMEAKLELEGRKMNRTVDEALAPYRKEKESRDRRWQDAEEHRRQQRRGNLDELEASKGKRMRGPTKPLSEVHKNLNRGMMDDVRKQLAPMVDEAPANPAIAKALEDARQEQQERPQQPAAPAATTGKKVVRPTSRQAMAEAKQKRKEKVKQQAEAKKQAEHEERQGIKREAAERRPRAMAALERLKEISEANKRKAEREAERKAGKERWKERKKKAEGKKPAPAPKPEPKPEKKPEPTEKEVMAELVREEKESLRPGAMDTVRKWKSDKSAKDRWKERTRELEVEPEPTPEPEPKPEPKPKQQPTGTQRVGTKNQTEADRIVRKDGKRWTKRWQAEKAQKDHGLQDSHYIKDEGGNFTLIKIPDGVMDQQWRGYMDVDTPDGIKFYFVPPKGANLKVIKDITGIKPQKLPDANPDQSVGMADIPAGTLVFKTYIPSEVIGKLKGHIPNSEFAKKGIEKTEKVDTSKKPAKKTEKTIQDEPTFTSKAQALAYARQQIENGDIEGALGHWSPVETEDGWQLREHDKPIFPSIKTLKQFDTLSGKELDMAAVALGIAKKKAGEKNADREKRIRAVYDLYTSLQVESVDSLVARLKKPELRDMARELGLYKSIYNKSKLAEAIIKWRDDNIIKASIYREHNDTRKRLQALHNSKLPIPRTDAEYLNKHGSIYTTADVPLARILNMDYLYPAGERGDNEWMFTLTENLVDDKKVAEFKAAMQDSPEALALLPELLDAVNIDNWAMVRDVSAMARAVGIPDQYSKLYSEEFAYHLSELLKDSEADTDNTSITESVSAVSSEPEVLPLDQQREILEKQLADSNKGDTNTVTVPGTNQKLEVQYKLVENSDVIASHNIKGDDNPAYPDNLQPRDRSRAGSEEQILTIAGKFDPELATGSVLTSDGAPIVNADNQVESGNGRTLALRNVYKTKPELAKAYKKYLIDHAAEFGLDPDRIRAMEEPQLVRERMTDLTPDQLESYLENSNEKQMAGKSPTEQAVSDAKVMTDELMAKFRPGTKGDLGTADNQEFLGRFYKAIRGDPQKLLTSDGKDFNQAFFKRLQGALFARAYQDNDLINLAIEEKTDGVENILKALNLSAPDFARINAKYADLGDLNMIPDLVAGIRVVRDAKAAKQSLDEYLNQGDMLSASSVDPKVAMFAQYIDLNNRRHKQMGEAFQTLAKMIDQELGRRGDADIFGDYKSKSTSDIVSPIVKNLKDQGKQIEQIGGNNDLFTASGKVRTQTQESGGPVSSGSLADQQGQGQKPETESTTKEELTQPDTDKDLVEIDAELDDALGDLADALGQLQDSGIQQQQTAHKSQVKVDAEVLAIGLKPSELFLHKMFEKGGDVGYGKWAKNMLAGLQRHGIQPETIKPYLSRLYLQAGGTVSDAIADSMDSRKEVRAFDLESLTNKPETEPIKETKTEPETASTKDAVFGYSDSHPQWASYWESEVTGGKVVYSDDTHALIEGYSIVSGSPVYNIVIRKGDSESDSVKTRTGPDTYTGEGVSAEQKKVLMEAEKRWRKTEDKKHQANPDGPFKKDQQVAGSDTVSKQLISTAENWLKMLGIDKRVFITTPFDDSAAAAEKYNLYGPYGAIRHASDPDSGEGGYKRKLSNGEFVIMLKDDSPEKMLVTLAHEIGHIVQNEAFDNADIKTVQNPIIDQFNAWIAEHKPSVHVPGSAKELIESMRHPLTADVTGITDQTTTADLTAYWSSFNEWFADNVARWATTQDKPLSVVDKFFKSVANQLRKLYKALTGKKYLPNTAMKSFLDQLGPADFEMAGMKTSPEMKALADDGLGDVLGGMPNMGDQLKKLNDRKQEHEKYDTIIQTAADDIDQLRGQDVERVLGAVDYGNDFSGMDHYLRQERPDLETKINQAVTDLSNDALTKLANDYPTFPGGWQRTIADGEMTISTGDRDYSVTFDPYADRFTLRDQSGVELTGVTGMKDAINSIKDFGKNNDVSSTADRLEPDSRDSKTDARQEQGVVPDESGAVESGIRSGISETGETGTTAGGRSSLSESDTNPAGIQGDQSTHQTDQSTGTTGKSSGDTDSGRGSETDAAGHPAQRPGDQTTEIPSQSPALSLEQKIVLQKEAESIPVVRGDLDNIRETLPVLMPEQQEDVSFIEQRLWENDERGGMLTNGTGTGKTFSGMGTIKRFVKEGKNNILIVTPSQAINSAWTGAGEALGVDISVLPDTKSAGEGVVVTTYANLSDNDALASRDWDLIVTDESHNLKESNDFDQTRRLSHFRALTGHPQGVYTRAEMQHPELVQKLQSMPERIKILEKSDNNQDWMKADRMKDELSQLRKEWSAITKQVSSESAAMWKGKQVKSLMLSATPFAHRKTVDYGEGFLFDYPQDDKAHGYYSQSGQNQFFIQNFGYRFRYGKLTEPDVDVDVGLMEREFNQKLKKSGAMRSRMLEVEKDYDRKFELVEGGVGAEVDTGLKWLDDVYKEAIDANKKEDAVMWKAVKTTIDKRFTYHTRAYLLESIKAQAAVSYIQQNLDMGRKVVAFHDYNTGGGFHPFKWTLDMEDTAVSSGVDARKARQGFDELARLRPDLINLPLENLANPRDTFTAAFGDQLVLYSGQENKKQRATDLKAFNDDNGDKKVILINSAAGNSGISLHDTTGKNQRVLLNLGIPVRPTFAIQIEGRIYRVGLQSNALFRYMSTGLTFERYMVSSKLAARAGTAENLAMGNDARALEDAFIEAYKDAGTFEPGTEGEGIGGKARDRQIGGETTDFDKAKTFYFAKQKRTQKNKAQEGIDYFATPEPLGLKVIEWLNAKPGDSMLEPSAGDGSMARWMPDFASVTAVEPSYELAGQLSMNAPTAKVVSGRFEDLNLQNKYDGIAMNPPYGKASKTAVDHVGKAFKHLRDGGRMIAIIPQGPASDTKLNKWYESKDAKSAHIAAEINLPSITFDRAGTKVATRIIIIDRIDDPNVSVPSKRTLDLQADNIKDFFDQIQELEFSRERIEKTPEQKTAEITDNPQQWLETKGLDVTDNGNGVFNFKGKKTYEFKSILKNNGAIWDRDNKAWTIDGDPEQTLAQVASDIDNYQNSPLSELKMMVTEKDGKFIISGEGTKKHKAFIREQGGKWDRFRGQWVMDSDPTESLLKQAVGSERYKLADVNANQIHRKPYENKAIADKTQAMVGDLATVVQSVNDLPKHLQDQIRNDDLAGRVKGVFDPRTGQVYVIASHADSVRDAVRTAIHEAVGHKGLRGVLGDRINTTLDQIYNSLPDSQIRELREVYTNQIAGKPQAEQRRIIAEEYLAHIAETEPGNNFLQKVIAKVRQWLRSVMPSMKWTDNDVRQLIMDASDYAKKPADNRPGIDQPGTNPDRVDTPDAARYKIGKLSNIDGQNVKKEVGQNLKSMKEFIRSKSLGWLGGRQIAEVYSKVFDGLIEKDSNGKIIRANPLAVVKNLTQELSATRNEYANKADKVDQSWSKLAGDKRRYQLTADTMHESTLLGQDPSIDYIPTPGIKQIESDWKSAIKAGDEETRRKLQPKIDKEVQREKDYKKLKTLYDGIGETGQQVYSEVKDYYEKMWDAQKQALIDRVKGMGMDPHATGKIKAEVEAMFRRNTLDGPYFPLMRFGEFAAIGTTPPTEQHPEGQPYREHFESLKDMEQGIEQLEAMGYVIDSSGKNKQHDPRQMSGITDMSGKIYKALTSDKLDQIDMDDRMALMDEVNQIALAMLPELSAAKRSMHRKGIAGYDTNARRAFASTALHGANRLGRTKFGWKIESELNRMDDATSSDKYSRNMSTDQKVIGRSVAEEMRRRHDLNMNPNGSALAANITNAAFFWYLGGSAAAGLVNLTQNILVGLPQLGSKYGYAKASRIMAKAALDYFRMGKRKMNGIDDILGNAWFTLEDAEGLDQGEIDMINSLVKDGTIDVTQAHTLANIAGQDLRPESQKSKDWYTKLTRASGVFFHNAEVANRQIMALTAYRLQKESARKAGKDFDANKAVDYTRDAVFDAHFDYSSYNRPRHFKGNWSKVFLIFKQHSQNMTYNLSKTFYDGVLDKELRGTEEGRKQAAQARRALIGTLGLHGMFAGVMGLPGFSVMMWAAAKAMGDKDDPVDPEVELRNFFADIFGVTNGHALAKGVFNGYLGIDMHQRTKLNDLWVSSPNYDMPARQEALHYVANGLGGPAVSQAVNMWVGFDEMTSGEKMSGIQKMMPKFIRDGLKTWDYSQNGVTDRKGEPILEQLTPGQKFWQATGFSPSGISEGYAAKGAIQGARGRIQQRRQQLLNQLDKAARTDDQRLYQKTMAEVDRYNDVQRSKGKGWDWAILGRSNIRRSLSQRARRREESEQAVWLPSSQLGMRDLGRFALH